MSMGFFSRRKISLAGVLAAAILMTPGLLWASSDNLKIEEHRTGLYRNVFDQNFYYEGVHYLHLDRFYRALRRKKVRAADVNLFDEVPDSSFFTNRHFRKRLSPEAIAGGAVYGPGPDTEKEIEIVQGKFEGLNPGFFIKDARGEKYLLKFDPADYPELVTASEVITSRFYHAIGYNVPQYTLALVDPAKLVPGAEAKVIDDTGFKKKLTRERLEEYLLFVATAEDGRLRASASRILEGEAKGGFEFLGKRKSDSEDALDHELRRELRALSVFSAWLNNYDIRSHNSLDMLVREDGRAFLKHYLIDFNSGLGAAAGGPKPPMFTHEHMVDFGESAKAFFTLGWWEKPWQKRWREGGEEIAAPAVGYFDNRYFDPGKFKTQLPHYAFKDLTRADGFWAAKIIMSFSDADIKGIVKTGEFSNPEDAEVIAKTLIERRDMIGRYWFARATPLDGFEYKNGALTFQDLAVQYGFEDPEKTFYAIEAVGRQGRKKYRIKEWESRDQNSISIDPGWLTEYEKVDLVIRARREGARNDQPYVAVELTGGGITGILHQD